MRVAVEGCEPFPDRAAEALLGEANDLVTLALRPRSGRAGEKIGQRLLELAADDALHTQASQQVRVQRSVEAEGTEMSCRQKWAQSADQWDCEPCRGMHR
jgi:hypothetical protein